jgi:hypothetical protein
MITQFLLFFSQFTRRDELSALKKGLAVMNYHLQFTIDVDLTARAGV